MSGRLLLVTFFSGIAAAGLGGFLAVLIIALSEGPHAILGGLLFGLFGAVYAVPIAAPPAMILGGLLWRLRIQHGGIWSIAGAVAGLGCLTLGRYFPGHLGETVALLSEPEPSLLGPAFALAGAPAALFFRTLMRASIDQDEAATGS